MAAQGLLSNDPYTPSNVHGFNTFHWLFFGVSDTAFELNAVSSTPFMP